MSDYDSENTSTFIIYLDENNLYGWTMSECLPYEEFELLKNVDKLDVMSIDEKSEIGYFLEVDLESHMNYMNYTIIIHLLQENSLLLMICFQHIVRELLISMR